ncbi:hypothetical protein J6590_018922 [Homalodisca vitripennis]|nr:hypothetical protein J6590_018922 [Homalodisca vitripennis]
MDKLTTIRFSEGPRFLRQSRRTLDKSRVYDPQRSPSESPSSPRLSPLPTGLGIVKDCITGVRVVVNTDELIVFEFATHLISSSLLVTFGA